MGFSKARVLEWGAIAFSELIATNPIFGSILKSRAITLSTKVRLVKAMVFTVVMYGLEKAVAPHFSTLAWKTLWTEKPGRLQSMGLQRVGHD